MDDAAVARFVSHYERVTRHMVADLPDHVDLLFQLSAGQDVISCTGLANEDAHVS